MYEHEHIDMERYEQAVHLLADILGCGGGDAVAILDMMLTHDDLIEATREFIEEVGVGWSFGAFVSGVERRVLNDISNRISDDLYDGIATVVVDDNYVCWGGVADSGDLHTETASVFAEMCREGVTDERVKRLVESYNATAGVGGYDDTV